jgi:UDP-glucose 6-dehydrogenase
MRLSKLTNGSAGDDSENRKTRRRFDGKQIGVLGLSFKPETDDMRESPAIDIIKEMQARGAKVKAFDPVAMEEAKHCLPDIEYAKTNTKR